MAIETHRRIAGAIASEIGARPDQVAAAAGLLDGGATVPFVARYRKEATGGLDDVQLRTLADRLAYLRELEARREAILGSIREQGKLTPALEGQVAAAETKAVLEDLYLPFKPKRRTKAMIARERGLGPLAEAILADRRTPPETLAGAYLSGEVPDAKEALAGARDILTEQLGENAALLGRLRAFLQREGVMSARLVKGQEEKGAKFSDYFAHSERWSGVPGHRALAMFRGANEGVLTLDIGPDPAGLPRVEAMVEAALGIAGDAPGDRWLKETARWAWRVKLGLSMMLDLMGDLRERAQDEAIRVFARNLKALLLAAPAGARTTMGLDPGVRTGVKVAVVDATGKLLATDTVYPFQPKNDVRGAQAALGALIRQHGVELIAIGNGTASRETERLVAETACAAAGFGEADEGGRVGGGGFGLFGVGVGVEGVPGSRRVTEGRRLDRAAAAGSAGGARQDRAQGDRRRAVPARRRPAQAGQVARGGGRGRGQRGRGRSQHRLGTVARARVGARAVPRRGDRRAPRTRRGHSAAARSCSRWRASGRGPSSRRRGSCGFATAPSRSTPRRCIRRPMTWRGGS